MLNRKPGVVVGKPRGTRDEGQKAATSEERSDRRATRPGPDDHDGRDDLGDLDDGLDDGRDGP